MAHKAKNGAGGTPKETPPSIFSEKAKATGTRLTVQAFNKLKKPAAKLFAETLLTPDQMRWIAEHENGIDTSSTILSILTPSTGNILGFLPWELTDDFQQDFVHEVIELCKEKMKEGTVTTSTPTGSSPAFDKNEQVVRVQVTLASITDRRKQDDFLVLYKRLTEEQRTVFLGVVAKATDDELKNIIQLPATQLSAMLTLNPTSSSTSSKGKALTYLELRAAIAADTTLTQNVTDFLVATGGDTVRFWKGIESKVHSLEEFKNLMALDNNSIIRHLELDKPSFDERLKSLKDTVTGIVDGPAGVPSATRTTPPSLSRHIAYNEGLLDKIKKLKKKTPGTGGVP